MSNSENERIYKELEELEQKTGVNLFSLINQEMKRVEEHEKNTDDDYIDVDVKVLELMYEMKRIINK